MCSLESMLESQKKYFSGGMKALVLGWGSHLPALGCTRAGRQFRVQHAGVGAAGTHVQSHLLSAIHPQHALTPGDLPDTAPPACSFPPAVPGNASSSPYPHVWLARGEKSPRLTYLAQQSLSLCLGGGNPAQLPGWEKKRLLL